MSIDAQSQHIDPKAALESVTLVDLLEQGDTKSVLAACRRMFEFEQTQS